jgi:hypothetical protein
MQLQENAYSRLPRKQAYYCPKGVTATTGTDNVQQGQ